MNDRKAINEIEARRSLVLLANAMLDGTLSSFGGSSKILEIKSQICGIANRDKDFDAFVVVQSGTDYLPLEK